MEEFQLPNRTFSFHSHPHSLWCTFDCFAFPDCKVLCTNQFGHGLLFDAESNRFVTMPKFHKPKSMPATLFVPTTDAEANMDGGGTIYIMETDPDPESCSSELPSDQFEALVYKPTMANPETWYSKQIPPPLFVRDPAYQHTRSRILSYAVVGGGSRSPCICISVDNAGTYCMDTVSNTWTHIGNWRLPFYGKVEYVPELELWFGFSAESRLLAAADLSTIFTMDSQPQLVSDWKEHDIPEDWEESQDPHLVNLGSGRFCVTRFFEPRGTYLEYVKNLVVLTGVNVSPHVPDDNSSGSYSDNGKVNLEVTTLKSRYHMSNGTTIEAVY